MFINDLFALPEIGTEKYKSHDMFKLFISSQSTVTISQFPTVIRIVLRTQYNLGCMDNRIWVKKCMFNREWLKRDDFGEKRE